MVRTRSLKWCDTAHAGHVCWVLRRADCRQTTYTERWPHELTSVTLRRAWKPGSVDVGWEIRYKSEPVSPVTLDASSAEYCQVYEPDGLIPTGPRLGYVGLDSGHRLTRKFVGAQRPFQDTHKGAEYAASRSLSTGTLDTNSSPVCEEAHCSSLELLHRA